MNSASFFVFEGISNLHPGLILIAAGILALALPYKARIAASIIAPVLAITAVCMLSSESALTYDFTSTITLNLIHADRLSIVFSLIFAIISLIAGIYGLKVESKTEKCAMLVYAGSSICVTLAGDFISLIGFWEIMAVASWYVVYAGKTDKAKRASYRYLVLHFFGGNMLLAGVILLQVNGITEVGALTVEAGPAFWLVLIGISVNAAVVPLHTWIPDAYPEATYEGTVYLGSFTTKVGIYCLIRIFAGTEFLLVAGVIMAIYGAAMALIENDLRRLLSYHIVSQLGFMVVALACGSAVGIDGAAAHAFNNILYKGTLLMCAGAVIKATGKRKITELGGLAGKMPVTALCFLAASLAISGMPFFNGFASKALVMEAIEEGGYHVTYWLMTVAGVGTWMSVALKINYFVFFGKEPGIGKENIKVEALPGYMNLAMILGALSCIVTGVMPGLLYNILPFATDAHPFTLHHIAEYVALFIGSTAAFFAFKKIMMPHDQLSLDFDWFYRKPMAFAVFGFSRLVHELFMHANNSVMVAFGHMKAALNTPWDKFSWYDRPDEENMSIGIFMMIFLGFCVVCAIFAAVLR